MLVALQGNGGDAGEVGAVGQQPGHDGVGEVVLGTGDHRIRMARKRGLLGPATPGKAGG